MRLALGLGQKCETVNVECTYNIKLARRTLLVLYSRSPDSESWFWNGEWPQVIFHDHRVFVIFMLAYAGMFAWVLFVTKLCLGAPFWLHMAKSCTYGRGTVGDWKSGHRRISACLQKKTVVQLWADSSFVHYQETGRPWGFCVCVCVVTSDTPSTRARAPLAEYTKHLLSSVSKLRETEPLEATLWLL